MKKKFAIGVVVCLIALLVPGRADAAVVLACDGSQPADGGTLGVDGVGTAEHWILQQDIYIPKHEDRCPTTVGNVRFTQAPDTVAIKALVDKLALFAGLNQPLSTQEWASAAPVYHLPLMIDGFVVTANVPCTRPPGAELKLDPMSLSLIYSGVVTRWGDRALVLASGNSWLEGCSAPIKVAVRDGSAWPNVVLKDYMSKENRLFLPYKQRDRLGQWPGALDVACSGSEEDHMVLCARLSGAISYMRFQTALANGLTPVALANGKDVYAAPTTSANDLYPSGCNAAVVIGDATVPWTANAAGAALDWSNYSITYPNSGYALCGMGFVVNQFGNARDNSSAARNGWKDHLRVMWAPETQVLLKDYGYAPLPETLRAMIITGPAIGAAPA